MNCFAYFVRYLLGKFFGCFAYRGYGMHHSLYTHTHIVHIMSGPYTRVFVT